MTLKHELQKIDPRPIVDIAVTYNEKITSLREFPAEFRAESLALTYNYPALCAIINAVEHVLGEDYSIEELVFACSGASLAVSILSEIAELQLLPPAD